jgi:hypothetical protein
MNENDFNITAMDRLNAYDAGLKAYWNYEKQDTNPYTENQELRDEWMLGWLRAQEIDQEEI